MANKLAKVAPLGHFQCRLLGVLSELNNEATIDEICRYLSAQGKYANNGQVYNTLVRLAGRRIVSAKKRKSRKRVGREVTRYSMTKSGRKLWLASNAFYETLERED